MEIEFNKVDEQRYPIDTDSICYGCKHCSSDGSCESPGICIEESLNDYKK